MNLETLTNSAEPDQMSQNAASDLVLQCLLRMHFYKTAHVVIMSSVLTFLPKQLHSPTILTL